jgi:flagellar FliJ protein
MKKRAERLQLISKLATDKEQQCALRMVSAQARLDDAAQRGSDLKGYLKEYQQAFEQRAKAGIGVTGLRDFQVFIARIGEAVRQQDTLINHLRDECERSRAQWRHAAARKNSLGKLLAKARSEVRQLEERQQQREFDERAQRVGMMRR